MSITAHDWITQSVVAPAVFDRWPDYGLMLVAADSVDVEALAPAASRLLAEATEFARSLDPAEPDEHIARWHDAYRDFGVKPRVARVSVDALIRRATSDNGLPQINVLVDLYNAVSVLHGVPIGGENLENYHGPAQLVLAAGDEAFHTTANGEAVIEHPDNGEPIWTDDNGVTCRRWNWRQTTRTAIRTDTQRVGFIIDSLHAPAHAGARRAADQLCELIGNVHIRFIDRATR
ncbi:unannotated protein [freshwater metagenome]|uniref:Unannotated protein n=1 Tax=freshwater metagenome TaxID=449393 RepID=A0A6J7FW47_9ZZZZ|nr:hypothetical protein [Actinomycetota bacterium]